MTYYIVYKTINLVNGKYYIGAHSTDKLDDGYIGSGKILKKAIEKYGIENFKREIISFCDSKKEMFLLEKELLHDNWKNEICYNVKPGGLGGWDHIPKDQNKNKVLCKDNYGNIFLIDKNVFEDSENLYGISKGLVTCLDLETGNIIQASTETFNKSKNLVGINFGRKESEETKRKKSKNMYNRFTVYDMNTGQFIQTTIDEYKNNDDLITTFKRKEQLGIKPKRYKGNEHHLTKHILIYNNNDELIFECNETFSVFCKLNNLPLGAFSESYKNDGAPIYSKTRVNDLPKLINKGFDKYIGWYAKIRGNEDECDSD